MISTWSNCSKELLNSLQTIQNRAARIVTKNSWEEHNVDNLRQIGWLSVNQLAQYHSNLLLHQVKFSGSPRYLHDMYNWEYRYSTRQATSNMIKPKGTPKLEVGKGSFRWRAARDFNSLPADITDIEDKRAFKIKTKDWILKNVSFRR